MSWIKTLAVIGACGIGVAVAQVPSNSPYDYVNRLSNYRWEDNNHYAFFRKSSTGTGSENVVIHVKTGKEQTKQVPTSYTPSVISVTKNGDVRIAARNGKKEVQLRDMQNTMLSPDSSHLAYTKGGNLFLYHIDKGEVKQLTNDGAAAIYNGWSSWIYNEEILGRDMNYRAFWWSPDSKKIAFMRFDDTQVPVHYMAVDTAQHVVQVPVYYPLPGDKNPDVSVGIYSLEEDAVIWADYDPKEDQYFGQPLWTPESDELYVQWLNRGQDSLVVSAVDPRTGKKRSIYAETQKTWVAIDQKDKITFLPHSKQFLVQSDKTGWMHVYLYDRSGKLVRPLTTGEWTVKSIDKVQEKEGVLYITGNRENSTRDDLYKVSLKNGQIDRLTFGEYTHKTQLSPDASYFISSYSNYKTPERIAILDNKGKVIRELADSKGRDYDRLQGQASRTELLRFRTADGFELPARISFPAKLDPNRKHGLMVLIYGGPNAGTVRDGYHGGFGDPMADTLNMIRVQIDHRGSGHFGKKGQDYMHRNLGDWEVKDYAFVVEEIKKKYPFIDPDYVGIKGFSYGGYITVMALLKAPETFKAGVAGGAVTDWKFYDSAYTERFMDTPKENPEGYYTSSTLHYVKNLQGKLSIAQGTLDDNVHMRNTIRLVDALQEERKQFELMLYPNAAHGWFFMRNKSVHSREMEKSFTETYMKP